MKKVLLDLKLQKEMNEKLLIYRPVFGDNNSIEINMLVGKINEKKCSVYDKNIIMSRIINLINITK